jgi:hypothetical protein
MAKNTVGDAAPDATERPVKTAPELTEDQIEDKNVDLQLAADDTSSAEPTGVTESDDATDNTEVTPPVQPPQTTKRPLPKRVASWLGSHKKLSIPLAVLLLIGVLAAIPATRFALAATVLKQQFSVTVVDAETKQPVTSAKVRIDGVEAMTDNKGRASIKLSVGPAKIEVSKKYFKSAEQSVTVPILKQKDVPELRLQATGRQVAVKLTNKISKKPLANVTITAADTDAKTDADGKATLVMPAGAENVEATFKADGFNDAKATIQVMKGEAENSFTLTPSGKVYFLSNQSGKLDVVKTNLDGTDRQTVLAGTGKEDKPNTSLLASRDWRYLALHSRRDSDKAKVYLIDTQTDKLSVMDEGDASFTLTGWSGHNFVYSVTRNKVDYDAPKRYAIKTFNADAQKLTTIDENTGEPGKGAERYSGVFILDNQILFAKHWSGGRDTKHTITTANADGKNKKTVKSYDSEVNNYGTSLEVRQYGPREVYIMFQTYDNGARKWNYTFEEYENGQIKALQGYSQEQFHNDYHTSLVSPSGDQTFWSEERDGVQTFFIGNKDGENEDKIAALAKYNAYGWYTNDYVLIAKEGNQLFIAPKGKLSGEAELTKVSDYYRPSYNYEGYGYGYGGL